VIARSIALLVMAAVAHGFTADPELGRPFDMKSAEVAKVEGLQITFEGVSEDSRCPLGVQCMWAGDAAATFRLEKPPAAAADCTLHTNGRFERETEWQGFVVRLEDVKPHPKEGMTIAADDYRATIVVTRPNGREAISITMR
jgi:hypothetical protein